jgi:hypothetical protein
VTEIAPTGAGRKPGMLLFLPRRLNRGAFLVGLRRLHAWTGVWGAIAFFCLGLSGFLLNHRDTLKISTGRPVEVSEYMAPVDAGLIESEEALGLWAQTSFHLMLKPKRPKDEATQDKEVWFLDRSVPSATIWRQVLAGPNGDIQVDYLPGSSAVHVARHANTFLATLVALHKGAGLGIAWVLVIDTFAGALVAMSLTGVLLWSRLHGPRLAAIGLMTTSVTVALAAMWNGLV